MPASYNDMSILAGESGFGNRVASALWQTCVNVSNETWSSSHLSRKNLAVQILNNPAQYKPLFVNATSVDPTCISDATQGGTVTLTGANVGAQAALITDAHIGNAIAAAFNAFVSGI